MTLDIISVIALYFGVNIIIAMVIWVSPQRTDNAKRYFAVMIPFGLIFLFLFVLSMVGWIAILKLEK